MTYGEVNPGDLFISRYEIDFVISVMINFKGQNHSEIMLTVVRNNKIKNVYATWGDSKIYGNVYHHGKKIS